MLEFPSSFAFAVSETAEVWPGLGVKATTILSESVFLVVETDTGASSRGNPADLAFWIDADLAKG